MGLGYCSGKRAETESSVILVPSLDGDNDKWCWKCQQYKDISAFYSDTTRYDGLKDVCKECDNKSRKKRYRKNKEQLRLNRSQHRNKPDYFNPKYKKDTAILPLSTKK